MSSTVREPSSDIKAADALPVIQSIDRCDRCSQRPVAIIRIGTHGEIYLCGHDYRANKHKFNPSNVSFRYIAGDGQIVDGRSQYE